MTAQDSGRSFLPPRAQHDDRSFDPATGGALNDYLQDCRDLILGEIGDMMPRTRHGQRLYDLMRDYPLRGGKALRPALCIATCRALGGHVESALRSAAAIELYHNAFLVHDDIEDGSELRRAEPTLHRKYGVPIAVNVGDGMLALSMSSLLANTDIIGVGKTLRVLETVSRMARESAEGQMIELDWIARGDWAMTDASYVRMVYKKTTWYSFITPIRVGAIGAGATPARITGLTRFAIQLGVAFQIHDDVLNLVGSAAAYGKEIAGDLWEGKHTLILIHTMRSASASERTEAARILGKARPPFGVAGAAVQTSALGQLVSQLHAGSEISANACQRLCAAIDGHADHIYKSPEDIATLTELIERYDSVGYARRVAERRAALAARSLQRIVRGIPTSAHTEFLRGLVDFVIRRTA